MLSQESFYYKMYQRNALDVDFELAPLEQNWVKQFIPTVPWLHRSLHPTADWGHDGGHVSHWCDLGPQNLAIFRLQNERRNSLLTSWSDLMWRLRARTAAAVPVTKASLASKISSRLIEVSLENCHSRKNCVFESSLWSCLQIVSYDHGVHRGFPFLLGRQAHCRMNCVIPNFSGASFSMTSPVRLHTLQQSALCGGQPPDQQRKHHLEWEPAWMAC